MTKITEQPSLYRHLEKMSIEELTANINNEDKKVALAIEEVLPKINLLIQHIVAKLENGGRLFYLGAGSGGRLSVLDAIELPTTYGIPKGKVNVILAGGVDRLIEAREEKEDDPEAGWEALEAYEVSEKDFVLGISASGTTPFVLGALKSCRANGVLTGCIVSNPDSPIAENADYPVEVLTGPEFVSGSTRMKCGTAQKMIFDMISTTCMIRMGRVEDNKMVNVLLINDKIVDRSVKMLMERAAMSNYEEAKALLMDKGSVKSALESLGK
ncbi:N-acetylmuramic acid 6-phosphate etherase [Cyclobacterium sp. 1_MG-2023]|uniref:N-acetylmuramic acid 6-phosphate etherase n=1 Tax=Cyclobacterium sp. 1_MG-2023 TaxID=3062681 RepID=UPI0026E123DC|nr:N-acetylmuramic acid 6-phosphate etherase [Cyclobacterium sp. 1_MG-2023]MDO6438808.1 N-acetylmuramic acid 6-phosphate etherase [Cyclobacterium sp. 1_MG-2023]